MEYTLHDDDIDSRAIAIMSRRPDLLPMSLDEWMIEHWDLLSANERKECQYLLAEL